MDLKPGRRVVALLSSLREEQVLLHVRHPAIQRLYSRLQRQRLLHRLSRPLYAFLRSVGPSVSSRFLVLWAGRQLRSVRRIGLL